MARYSKGRLNRGRGPHVARSVSGVPKQPRERRPQVSTVPQPHAMVERLALTFKRFDKIPLKPNVIRHLNREASRLGAILTRDLGRRHTVSLADVYFALKLKAIAKKSEKVLAPIELAQLFFNKTGNSSVGPAFLAAMGIRVLKWDKQP